MEHDTEIPEEATSLPQIVLGENGQGEPGSLIDNLRKKREELEETREAFIPIPGYDREPPVLLAKYRLLEGHEIDKIGTKIQRETKDRWQRQMLAAVDTFIAACEGLYYDEENGEGPQPMTFNDQPILGYNADLSRALQYDAETARQVVFGLFTNNDIAILQHGARLSLWMGNTTRRIDEDFLGEV